MICFLGLKKAFSVPVKYSKENNIFLKNYKISKIISEQFNKKPQTPIISRSCELLLHKMLQIQPLPNIVAANQAIKSSARRQLTARFTMK